MSESKYQYSDTLKNFMEEFFDFQALKKAGFYSKEVGRKDYEAQAARVCEFFGFDSVYQYGTMEFRAHLSMDGGRESEPFVTEVKNIYTD